MILLSNVLVLIIDGSACLLIPVSWILAPPVEQLYVFLLDIDSLQSLCHYVLIVGQSNQLDVSISKSLLGDRETIGIALSLIHIYMMKS